MRSAQIFLAWMGVLVLVSPLAAGDGHFEGRARLGGTLMFEPPPGFSRSDREAEIRLGAVGTALERDVWTVDYEVIYQLRHEGGSLEEVGLADAFDADFFRAWLRLDRGDFKVRGGRQQILFGAGVLFRPLGFFDNRVVSGILPETQGVDGVRATWFPTASSLVEGWIIPARLNSRVVAGGRAEWQWGVLEAGAAAQYKPVTDIDFLPGFDLELSQFGFHLKGEKEIGFWNETRLDIEQNRAGHPLRFNTVLGADYTFDLGEGLHVLLEYSFLAEESGFTRTDVIGGDRDLHQLGFMLDQPVGINTVWRSFLFLDLEDGSFQFVPQVEYAVTEQTFLYLQLQIGGRLGRGEPPGRLFRKAPLPNGTESRIGMTLISYF